VSPGGRPWRTKVAHDARKRLGTAALECRKDGTGMLGRLVQNALHRFGVVPAPS